MRKYKKELHTLQFKTIGSKEGALWKAAHFKSHVVRKCPSLLWLLVYLFLRINVSLGQYII